MEAVAAGPALFVVHNSPVTTLELQAANFAQMIYPWKETNHGASPYRALSLARRVHQWA